MILVIQHEFGSARGFIHHACDFVMTSTSKLSAKGGTPSSCSEVARTYRFLFLLGTI